MLAVVINSELLDILFFDPRRGEKQITQIGNRYAFPFFTAKWNFIEIVEIAVIVPGLTFNQSDEIFLHAFGRATGGNCQVNATHL